MLATLSGYLQDMSRAILIGAALAALALAGTADARGPIEGRWAKGNMQIDIKPCGSSLCGTIVKASPKQQARAENGSGTELVGARVINQIRPIGRNSYKARVFLADRNMNASGKITQLNPNRLRVSGCVLAFLCRTTHWDRVN
jgi:uncharacterized protein (DUF2147 family)